MDIGSIASLATSLKSASDIARAMVDLRDTTAFQSKLIELQKEIMSAQSSALTANSDQLAMLERIRGLESKLVEAEAWSRETKRYKLTDFGAGTFAYVLIAEESGGEPIHRLCVTCYQDGRKSILQFRERSYLSQDVHFCARCKAEVALGTPVKPSSGGRSHAVSWKTV